MGVYGCVHIHHILSLPHHCYSLQPIGYLQSKEFAKHLIAVCESVSDIFEDEPKVIEMQSPTYVIGDIHGNLEDLHFFADNLWKLGKRNIVNIFLLSFAGHFHSTHCSLFSNVMIDVDRYGFDRWQIFISW